jgi:hypothetical protein
MPLITMGREFIARSTKMPRSIGRLSASALSRHGLSSAVFITYIAESDFRHTQASGTICLKLRRLLPKRSSTSPKPDRREHTLRTDNYVCRAVFGDLSHGARR